ncbi:MAG: glycosyltransferase family 4 protein [Chthoniobacterales bacterium]
MRVIIATTQIPFVYGGAEAHAAALEAALREQGHQVALFTLPFNPAVPERIFDQMLACRLFDLAEINAAKVDRLIALKFPAYLIPHPNKVVWLLHQHRAAYDLWDEDVRDLNFAPRGRAARRAIERADRTLGEARALFANSKNVARRLRESCQLEATPLYHPPPGADDFYCAERADDYFFFPSRIHVTKRQRLVLEALALTTQPVRIWFAGVADDPAEAEQLQQDAVRLKIQDRVQWMQHLTEKKKIDTYARALAVIYPPLDEDYGYVTLEAMLSSKPVITCTDSGGPLEFVLGGETGLIANPEPTALAAAFDELWSDRAHAAQMGVEGRRHYEQLGLSWPQTVERLLA